MTEDKEKTKGWPPEPSTEAMEHAPEEAEVDVARGDETTRHKTRKNMEAARRENFPEDEP